MSAENPDTFIRLAHNIIDLKYTYLFYRDLFAVEV